MKNSNLLNKILMGLGILLLSIVLIFLIPIMINESYKSNSGYLTLWNAEDVLAFYSVVLSGIITFVALFITIKHSRKDTIKQIRLTLSQVNQPFFVIESVKHQNSPTPFNADSHGNLYKAFTTKEDGTLHNVDKGKIIVEIKNIGDGIALSPNYDISMFAIHMPPCSTVVKSNNLLAIEYDFVKNLDDVYVKHSINNTNGEGTIIFNTYINIKYFNTMGIQYSQTIKIDIEKNFANKNEIKLLFNEISPQEIDIDNSEINI